METCIRGFSYMPDNKFEEVDLKYIEEGELERTWKIIRRERLKQREQKVWEEFVKERDIVGSVYEDDKYQFLEQLPDSYLSEIMESELQKMKQDLKPEEKCQVELQESSSTTQVNNGDLSPEVSDQQPCVTFAEVLDKDDCDVFHIFDENEQSGLEEDNALNESMNSPTTVRERQSEPAVDVSLERPSSDMNTSSTGKSSENVANVIETSIYCAKVKDLRIKINDEILEIINTFDRRDIFCMEREEIARMIKRSAEFCTRFNRIYMYQLQRQMHDIKRNNSLKLPFAKHTQFQSQMIRVVSLHQNLLQAFQVFHKSVDQTWFERESSTALRALVGAARNATAHCTALSQPRDLPAAYLLYNDDVLSSCDKLEQFVNQYTIRCDEFLNGFINMDDKKKLQKSTNNNTKKRPIQQKSNSKSISDSGGRLSMYSLDRLRINGKSSITKDMQSGTANYGTAASVYSKNCTTEKREQPPKSNRKSPRCRRPLMRDPQAGNPRPPRGPRPPRSRDYDICTMVEQVEPCASSHASRDSTPEIAHRTKVSTPRTNRTPRRDMHHISRKSQPNTPRRLRPLSPKFPRSPSPKLKSTLNNILSDKRDVENVQLISASKIQSTKKKRNTKGDMEKDSDTSTYVKMPPKLVSSRLRSPNPELGSSNSQNVMSPKDLSPQHVSPEQQPQKHISQETGSNSKLLSAPTEEKKQRDGNKVIKPPEQCELSKLLKQLCSGDASGNRTDRTGNAKNAQLLYMHSSSPRPPPSTPQLLRILEETIQKKMPKSYQQKNKTRNADKYRLSFNPTENVADNLFQYRTKFVQHMLTSPMYANSDVGKPWEMIGSVSEQIIDEVIQNCVKEMELTNVIQELYKRETT